VKETAQKVVRLISVATAEAEAHHGNIACAEECLYQYVAGVSSMAAVMTVVQCVFVAEDEAAVQAATQLQIYT
jgi:precorrin-2 methylase